MGIFKIGSDVKVVVIFGKCVVLLVFVIIILMLCLVVVFV